MQFKINSLCTHPQVVYRGSSKCQAIHPFTTKSMIFSNNSSSSKVTPTWTCSSSSSSSRAIQSWRDKSRCCLRNVSPTQVCVSCLRSSVYKLFPLTQRLRLNSLPIRKSLQFCSLFTKFIDITFNFPTIKTHLHLYPELVFMSPSYLSCARALGAQHMNREDY